MKQKLISVIIPNHNGLEVSRDCLKSIKQNTPYKNYEVILVDDASTDSSGKKLKKEFPWIKLVESKKRLGFAGINNLGLKHAKGDYYYLLNNDTIVLKGWLEEAVKLLESDERIAAVGSWLIAPESAEKLKKAEIPDKEKMTVCAAGELLKASVLRKIGFFDSENFSPVYGEETDLNYRIHNAGFKLIESGKSKVIHLGSTTTRKSFGSREQYLLMNTHRLKAMLYNLSFSQFLKHVPGLGLIFFQSIPEGMFFTLLKSYWKNLKNLKDILRKRKQRKLLAEKIRAGLNF